MLSIGDIFAFKYEVDLLLKFTSPNNKTPLKVKKQLMPIFSYYEKTGTNSYKIAPPNHNRPYCSFYGKEYFPSNSIGYTIGGAEVILWKNKNL